MIPPSHALALSPANSLIVWKAPWQKRIATRVAICGDFLPAGNVPQGANVNWADLAAPISPHFADVDTAFANLECPLEVEGLQAVPLEGIGQIVCAQQNALAYLDAIHCKTVGIANNHAHDFGAEGVARTRAALIHSGLRPLGTSPNLANPPEVFILHAANGLRIGFWAAARAAHEFATHKSPGVEPATPLRAAQAIAELHRRGAHFSIALIHSGCIRASRPAPEDVAVLHTMAHSGFDLVAASHSHRISGAETLLQEDGTRPAFCFHGLGSIVSGYIASPLESEGLIVVVGFDDNAQLQEVTIRPVQIAQNGIGAVPDANVAGETLHRFSMLSAEIRDGSYKSEFYREISQGLVDLYIRDVRSALHQSGIRGLARKAARVRLHHVKRLVHGVFAP